MRICIIEKAFSKRIVFLSKVTIRAAIIIAATFTSLLLSNIYKQLGLEFAKTTLMRLLLALIIGSLVLLFCCKRKATPPKMLTYVILIDGIQNTVAGPVDSNFVEAVSCTDDEAAIKVGLEKYYNAVVKTELREKGPQPAYPYLLLAKGWAVLDEKGDNVKDRVRQSFVDSVNQQAVERARYDLQTLAYQ